MQEREVVINWVRTDLGNVKTLCGAEDYGLYEIDGYHPVFGDGALLYIGKAKKQTFGKRFEQHEHWLRKEMDIQIYFGRIVRIDNNEDFRDSKWGFVLDDAEALLIFYHSPPYNSRHISERPVPMTELRVINIGDYGNLYPEVSHKSMRLEEIERPSDREE